MLSRRGFFVIILLFGVVTTMFMTYNVSESILLKEDEPAQQSATASVTRSDTITAEQLRAAAAQPDGQPVAALLVSSQNSSMAKLLQEWCVYNKYPFRIFTSLPDASSLQNFALVLVGDLFLDTQTVHALVERTCTSCSLIFLVMPDPMQIATNAELSNLLGIRSVITASCVVRSIHLFADFFVGGERIYSSKDGAPAAIPHYALREGYEVYANGIPEEEMLYTDYPPLLWRTHTGQADVYVTNTDIFAGKSLLGLITAFVSQTQNYYLYPIVNARTVSVQDFPCLSEENASQLEQLYSRSSNALTRDLLWPAVEKIARIYGGKTVFLAAPQLDYSHSTGSITDLVLYYRSQIVRMSGALGLSLKSLNRVPLQNILDSIEHFAAQNMEDYHFRICSVESGRLQELKQCSSSLMQNITLVLTDTDAGQPLLEFLDDDILVIGFTDDGFAHNDLEMVSLVTTLGMVNQTTDMSHIYYPSSSDDLWANKSTIWSRNVTYAQNFSFLDTVSAAKLEEKSRALLALQYTAAQSGNQLQITVDSPAEENDFFLRLYSQNVVSAQGAEVTKVSDTVWLVRTQAAEAVLELADRYSAQPPVYGKKVNP